MTGAYTSDELDAGLRAWSPTPLEGRLNRRTSEFVSGVQSLDYTSVLYCGSIGPERECNKAKCNKASCTDEIKVQLRCSESVRRRR